MPSAKDLSGFTEEEITKYSKYFDLYSTNSSYISYNNRILGDATGEMGPFYYYADNDNIIRYHNNWYGDGSNFVDSYNSWFIRSGAYDYGVHSGQFYFFVHTGSGNIGASFRIVLM